MPYPFQIFQSESGILITYEYAGAVRECSPHWIDDKDRGRIRDTPRSRAE